MKELGLSAQDAQDRQKWRRVILDADLQLGNDSRPSLTLKYIQNRSYGKLKYANQYKGLTMF